MRRPRFLTMVIVVTTCVVFWGSGPLGVFAGDLEPPLDAVDETGKPVSTMTSLDEIDAKLDAIYELIDPGCPQCTDAGVPATGQKVLYGPGDDGMYERGVVWPVPRFIDNGDGTVNDQLTGLIWLKGANCFGITSWSNALVSSNSLADGQCGLSDGSDLGDWRLPNVRELYSLIDFSNFHPAMPSGHPFTGVQPSNYWSSTTFVQTTELAYHVNMNHAAMFNSAKNYPYWVWPVRGGN